MMRFPAPGTPVRAAAIACWLVAQTHMAAAQTLGRGAEDDISVWRILAALVVCLLLAAAGALVLRYRMGHAAMPALLVKRQRRLRVIESLRLGRQVTLSIVQCDERELLLLTSETQGQVIEAHAAPLQPGGGQC